MEELIERLDKWLRINRPEYYQQLLPGLSDKEVNTFERELGVKLPEEFKLFYKWKNGQSEDYLSFIHNLSWLKAECVISSSRITPEVESDGFLRWTDEMWQRDKSQKWITFLTDSASHEYILDLAGLFNGKEGQIISYWGESPDGDAIIHESFYKWLETVVLSFEKGLFKYDENEGMIAYGNSYQEFLKENNPGYPILLVNIK